MKTAVDIFYDLSKKMFDYFPSIIVPDLIDRFETYYDSAKQIERDQHGRTWDAAIDAFESRGVKERAFIDFDEYKIQ